MKKAIILISGGLDSATCLAIAKDKGYECHCISVDYGQKQIVELIAAKNLTKTMGAKSHKIVKMDLSSICTSALTTDEIEIPEYNKNSDEIPSTYVPARNTVFLSLALGFAESIGAYDIFIGACEVDYSGYPDCRRQFIDAFESMSNLATKAGISGGKFTIHTPLMYLSKAETILTGHKLKVDYSKTITCYKANEEGEACGKCDSCYLRRRGFIEADIEDNTKYINTEHSTV